MKYAALLVLVACYAPHPGAGSPCGEGSCPAGLVCSPASQTCEVTASDAALVTAVDAVPVAPIDGNTSAPPANDLAGGAIDVSAGGTFTASLDLAHDDAPNNGCGNRGGRDVFYTITLTAAEVIYLDTFGSSFATELRVYAGKACNAITSPTTCNDNVCNGTQSQVATTFPLGTSCIVVDQKADEATASLVLHVKRGGRTGTRLPSGTQTITGDSCATGTNAAGPPATCSPSDDNTAKDVGYFFTACPATTLHLDASTCADPTQTHFDTVVYLRQAGAASLACDDDDNTCGMRPDGPNHGDGSILRSIAASGPDLFWLTVDGYQGACGGYQLTTTLQ